MKSNRKAEGKLVRSGESPCSRKCLILGFEDKMCVCVCTFSHFGVVFKIEMLYIQKLYKNFVYMA